MREAPSPTETVVINASDSYAVSSEVYWRYDTAPRGVKLFLLTIGGVAITGDWRDNSGFIAWHPLPKRNKELEERLGLR